MKFTEKLCREEVTIGIKIKTCIIRELILMSLVRSKATVANAIQTLISIVPVIPCFFPELSQLSGFISLRILFLNFIR